MQRLDLLFTDANPATQGVIAPRLFSRVEVRGSSHFWLYPSGEAVARGWAAGMNGEFRVELREFGRGERYQAGTNDVVQTVRSARGPRDRHAGALRAVMSQRRMRTA
jgi:cellulase/cellobiase CelA1